MKKTKNFAVVKIIFAQNLYLIHKEKKDEEREIRGVAINVELADGRMGTGASRRACTYYTESRKTERKVRGISAISRVGGETNKTTAK